MKVNNLSIYNKPQNTNFRGVWKAVGNANRGAMQYLERGGFFAEFCLMDIVGLVLPRVYQGFQRNKKELGHLNYQAGFEELLREIITGPSMFLIPIGAVILAGKALGKATTINFNLLDQFSKSYKELGENSANKGIKATRKAFAENLFQKLFANNLDAKDAEAIGKYKTEFVEKLTAGVGKKLTKTEAKENLGKFVDLVADINAAHFNREYTHGLVLNSGKEKIATTASDLFKDARKYMEDVIPSAKLSFKELVASGKNMTKTLFEETINKITKVRHNGHELLCLGGTAALAAFLCIIPKIYQLSKKNPALKGLENDNKLKGGK